jgi:hypothetical protein
MLACGHEAQWSRRLAGDPITAGVLDKMYLKTNAGVYAGLVTGERVIAPGAVNDALSRDIDQIDNEEYRKTLSMEDKMG